jgi:hypothetical protein
MARFVEFTDRLGSDSMLRVDGRLSMHKVHSIAEEYAQRLRFVYTTMDTRTYVISQGSSLLSAKPITKPRTVKIDRSKDQSKTRC